MGRYSGVLDCLHYRQRLSDLQVYISTLVLTFGPVYAEDAIAG